MPFVGLTFGDDSRRCDRPNACGGFSASGEKEANRRVALLRVAATLAAFGFSAILSPRQLWLSHQRLLTSVPRFQPAGPALLASAPKRDRIMIRSLADRKSPAARV